MLATKGERVFQPVYFKNTDRNVRAPVFLCAVRVPGVESPDYIRCGFKQRLRGNAAQHDNDAGLDQLQLPQPKRRAFGHLAGGRIAVFRRRGNPCLG